MESNQSPYAKGQQEENDAEVENTIFLRKVEGRLDHGRLDKRGVRERR
jgi:hypothetical protein